LDRSYRDTNKDEDLKRASEIQSNLSKVSDTGDVLRKQILELADSRKSGIEWWYGVFKWLTYLLFILGWCLGLIGKLYGSDTGEGSE
jgi:hypothetical protein